MIPVPAGRNYGDLTNLDTLAGQNSAPPSQKVFGRHIFLKYIATAGGDPIYYDPSYGVTYNGTKHNAQIQFQDNALAGYGNIASPDAGRKRLKINKPVLYPLGPYVEFSI